MYKKGRKWLVAGVTVVGIGLGTLGVTTTSASADVTDTDAITTESTSVEAVKTDKQATLTAGTTSDTATTENGETSASSTTAVEAPATNNSDAAETTTTPQADEQKSAATNDQQTAPVADATTPAQSDTTTTPKQSDATTTQSTPVTNLGDATATDVDAAKVAGKAAYEATGTPQKVTAVAATTADELNYSATQNSEVHFFDRDGNEIGIGGSTGSTYSQDELNAITDILLTNSVIGERTPNQAGWTVDYANSTVNVTVDGVKTAYTLDEYFKKVLGAGLNATDDQLTTVNQEAQDTMLNEPNSVLKGLWGIRVTVAGTAVQDAYDKAVTTNSLADRYDFLARASYLQQPETLKVGGQVSDWAVNYVLFDPNVTVETPYTTEVKDANGKTISSPQSATNIYHVQTDADGNIISVDDDITTPSITDTIPDGQTLTGITIVDTTNVNGLVTTVTYDPRTGMGNVVTVDNDSTWNMAQEQGSVAASANAKAIVDGIISNAGNQYTTSFSKVANKDTLLANGNVNQISTGTTITYTVTADATINTSYTTEVKTDTGKVVGPTQTGNNSYAVQVDADGNIVSVDKDKTTYGDVTNQIPAGYDLTGVTIVDDTTSVNHTVTTITYDPTTGVGNYVLVTTDPDTGETVTTDYAAEQGSATASEMAKALYDAIITGKDNTYTTSFANLNSPDNLLEGNIHQLADKTTITYNVTAQPTSGTVDYINQDNNQVVKQDQLNGKVDDNGTYTVVVPEGYELVPGQDSNIDYTLAPDNGTKLTVKIRPISNAGDGGTTGPTTDPTNPTNPTDPTTPETTPTTPETTPTTDPTTPAEPEPTVVIPTEKPGQKPTAKPGVTPEPTTKVTKQAVIAVKTGTSTRVGMAGQTATGTQSGTIAANAESATAERLPQTNESETPTTVMGVALLGLMSLLGLGAKKRRED